jgi:5'(3')-deoxyribonucleotidase
MDKAVIDFKNRLNKEGICGLALDLDDTVADTAIVWIERIATELGNPEGLSMRELADKYSYGRGVNYWVKEEYEKVTMTMRHSGEFYENIPLIKNADKQVNEINKILPIVAFITARPNDVMAATENWIKKHKFPSAPMINRPSDIEVMKQFEWKAKVLEYLYPQVLGIVDDNLALVDCLSKSYKGTIFLYNQESVERNDIKIIPCKNWEVVAKKVKECKIW